MENIILSRDEFYNEFIYPLEQFFGFKTYWNSKKVEELGLKQLSSNYKGMSFFSRIDAPIVLKYTQNTYDMLNTLIHEYAHSFLHGSYHNHEGYSLNKNIKEVEAETVAKYVFEDLGLDYLNDWYITRHSKKCKQEDLDNYDKVGRDGDIEVIVDDIINLFKDKVDLINSLNRENQVNKQNNPYKYSVKCTCCNMEWKYKRIVKIVKYNAKNYWCSSCGKEKSQNKLVVKEI